MKKRALVVLGLVSATVAAANLPACAQGGFQAKIHQNELQKAKFYNAPRQVQILDERPIIRDFREAPQGSPEIALPPGPSGRPGGYGGNGAGALGDIPSGGPGGGNPIQLGGPGVQPYRSQNPNMQGGNLPLPKSGFLGPSNIPSGGIKPAGALPEGNTTNRLSGKMFSPKQPIALPGPDAGSLSGPAGRGGMLNKAAKPIQTASYGSNYGSSTPISTGSGNKTEGLVRVTLLTKTGHK